MNSPLAAFMSFIHDVNMIALLNEKIGRKGGGHGIHHDLVTYLRFGF